ncbi:hypothetical protein EJB05_29406 [Eragrostis curvula]|uniref:Uncharacterized protein n=1 Tax=Eragrostis curvula TaxID=38414 RepID=A0A5J9UU85_9POAL|nr:hypothetical protein EJB05_29406 [Eragrostis curvula]
MVTCSAVERTPETLARSSCLSVASWRCWGAHALADATTAYVQAMRDRRTDISTEIPGGQRPSKCRPECSSARRRATKKRSRCCCRRLIRPSPGCTPS